MSVRLCPIVNIVLFFSLVVIGCQQKEKSYGQPITATEKTSIQEIVKSPTQYHGRVVLIEGEIGAVCQDMGCWFQVADGTNQIKVDLQMGRLYVIPKNASEKLAVVEGRVQYDGSRPVHLVGTGTTIR